MLTFDFYGRGSEYKWLNEYACYGNFLGINIFHSLVVVVVVSNALVMGERTNIKSTF